MVPESNRRHVTPEGSIEQVAAPIEECLDSCERTRLCMLIDNQRTDDDTRAAHVAGEGYPGLVTVVLSGVGTQRFTRA